MTLIHIYDGETGKWQRSQEPAIDPVETSLRGETVYVQYPNATTAELPEYGKHELPFWVVDEATGEGKWVVKGQYKNVEVYNKDSKSFEYCSNEDLGENQVFIDDKDGIEAYKKTYKKYMVDLETLKIVENPKYKTYLELQELQEQYDQADTAYQEVLNTPVEFPKTGKLYKPIWVDDGTYSKLMTGALAGVVQFPIAIWDATKLEENMIQMDQDTFGKLVAFLANIQNQAFEARKYTQSTLLPQIEAKKAELGEE